MRSKEIVVKVNLRFEDKTASEGVGTVEIFVDGRTVYTGEAECVSLEYVDQRPKQKLAYLEYLRRVEQS